jgi:uncharacterized protein
MNKDRRREVLRIVRERFRLEWRGIYGVPHWARGADFALQLNSELLRLDRSGLEMLIYAVRRHSDGLTEADVTVQTCWDADRLDLGRVGIVPGPDRLCTEQARDPLLLDRAYRRSVR